MKDKRCFTCKYQGKISLDTQVNTIFSSYGKSHTVLLCYVHSIEFFKMGQKLYFEKYKQDMSEFVGTDDEDKHVLSIFSGFR